MNPTPKPRFFRDRTALRAWFEKHHRSATELWIGYWKVATGKPSITWAESVDEALCFGWIDGIRRGLGPESYTNRFTPRTRTSTWSERNVRRARELIAEGSMRPAGLAAFEARRSERSGVYGYEHPPHRLPAPYARTFRANQRAWEFWRAAPPSYRKAAIWWLVSAKKEETRLRRLATLVEASARSERVPPLRPPRR